MFPVLASTISLVAIFVPVIFLSGLLGKFLQPFAVVTVIGILVSWLVSLTITPMLSAKLSKENLKKNIQSSWTDVWELKYKNFLRENLDNKLNEDRKLPEVTQVSPSNEYNENLFTNSQVRKNIKVNEVPKLIPIPPLPNYSYLKKWIYG